MALCSHGLGHGPASTAIGASTGGGCEIIFIYFFGGKIMFFVGGCMGGRRGNGNQRAQRVREAV